MFDIHRFLLNRVKPYAIWHELDSHKAIHWAVLSFTALSLFFVLSGAIVSYQSEVESLAFLNRLIPRAQAAAPTSGLTGHWKFDEGSGTATADSSGSGLNCTISNAAWATGKIGQALDFNGTTSILDCGLGMNNLADFSISAWIDPDSFGEGGKGRIFEKSLSGSGRWAFSLNSTNSNFQFSMANSGGSSKVYEASANTISASEGWIHASVVITNCSTMSGCSVQLYKNGQPVTTTVTANPVGATRADDSSRRIHIGNYTDKVLTFDGLIDEVRAYSRALSAQEISDIYADTGSSGG